MKINKFVLLAVILATAIASSFATSMLLPGGRILADGPVLNSNVLITATHPDGTVFMQETHNVITNVSKNRTIECMMQATNCKPLANKYDYVALGNTLALNANDSSTSLEGELATCNLARAQASNIVIDNSSKVYNISATYQWTANADACVVNSTALLNASSAGTMLAVANFNPVTLNNGDKLNVNSKNF